MPTYREAKRRVNVYKGHANITLPLSEMKSVSNIVRANLEKFSGAPRNVLARFVQRLESSVQVAERLMEKESKLLVKETMNVHQDKDNHA